MKIILVIFSIVMFTGCLIVKLNYEVSPFWNGFVLAGLILSPLMGILYGLDIIKTRERR